MNGMRFSIVQHMRMMENNDCFSIDLDQMISYAKSLPSWDDARHIANYLNWQFRNKGTPEVFDSIDSIARHFKDHSEQAIADRIRRKLENQFHKQLGLPEIELTDDQVAKCIIELMPYMGFDNQWLAIYRILVDFCGYPKEIQAFCDKMDECLDGLRVDRPCRYQNIQKYLDGIFEKPYRQWLSYPHQEETAFARQKRAADKFLEIIRRKAEMV